MGKHKRIIPLPTNPGVTIQPVSHIWGYRGAGERESGGTPKRNFLKEVPLWTLFKNFKKGLFIKVFGVLRTFFQKGSKPPEAAPPLPYMQFEEWLNRYIRVCRLIRPDRPKHGHSLGACSPPLSADEGGCAREGFCLSEVQAPISHIPHPKNCQILLNLQ